jgi:hypothetical protein
MVTERRREVGPGGGSTQSQQNQDWQGDVRKGRKQRSDNRFVANNGDVRWTAGDKKNFRGDALQVPLAQG